MRVLGLVVVAACGFQHGQAPSDGASADGRPPDAPIDADAAPVIDAAIDASTFTCSAIGLTCSGTVSIFDCSNECWVSCTDTLTAVQAAKACKDWGGKLAPLRTPVEQQCLRDTIFPAQASWIGFEQANNATTPADGWSWNGDGQLPSFTSWSAGQPNDADGDEDGAEQCAYMSTSGNWQDTACSATLTNFACLGS